jgi:small subunit ribosomal protein S7
VEAKEPQEAKAGGGGPDDKDGSRPPRRSGPRMGAGEGGPPRGAGPGRGRRRRMTEAPVDIPPPPPEPVKYDFDFDFPPLFGKWDLKEVEINDISLKNYINLDPIITPHIGGKYANRPFSKKKVHIVERLINNMMRTEHMTGNKSKAYTIVGKAFEIINKKTKRNPVQVFIDAIEAAAPKEEITRLKYGGISVPKAVDIAATRRLDVALRNICKGAHQSSSKSKKKIEACLADEILRAANGDLQSFAIAKKDEIERIAASAR